MGSAKKNSIMKIGRNLRKFIMDDEHEALSQFVYETTPPNFYRHYKLGFPAHAGFPKEAFDKDIAQNDNCEGKWIMTFDNEKLLNSTWTRAVWHYENGDLTGIHSLTALKSEENDGTTGYIHFYCGPHGDENLVEWGRNILNFLHYEPLSGEMEFKIEYLDKERKKGEKPTYKMFNLSIQTNPSATSSD